MFCEHMHLCNLSLHAQNLHWDEFIEANYDFAQANLIVLFFSLLPTGVCAQTPFIYKYTAYKLK